MFIESDCTGCGKRLRVPDKHRGGKARCPQCNQVFVVGGEPQKQAAKSTSPVTPIKSEDPLKSEALTSTASPTGQQWLMRTPEGNTYGPVSKPDLDSWLKEGRISAECQLREATSSNWLPAASVYPSLNQASSNSGATWSAGSNNPYQAPTVNTGTSRGRYQAPHRGVLILVLALVGWISSCPVMSIIALILGNIDMAEINAGRMDREGRQMTEAGRIIALIHVCLYGLGFVVGCGCMIISAIADA